MYNRYIPQADGSYQRSRIHEPLRNSPPPRQQNPPQTQELPPVAPPQRPVQHSQGAAPVGISNFFRQLLPKNLDTADLLIILLLLLMAGDNEEEKANALLTMALYFLM